MISYKENNKREANLSLCQTTTQTTKKYKQKYCTMSD